MEAVMMKSTGDNKHRIINPNRNFITNRTLFPYPSDNILLTNFLAGGHFTGGSLPSYPPAGQVFRPPQNLHYYRQQPPLLPLPFSLPISNQNTNIARCNSASNNYNSNSNSNSNNNSNNNNNNNNIRVLPPRMNKNVNKNVKNRVRDHSLTPKKSKNQKKDSKKAVEDLAPPVTKEEKNDVIGPDPKDLPKEVVNSRVCSTTKGGGMVDVNNNVDEFTGSAVFTPSPPPSSLPLPTFFLRPKVSCKAEVSGIDVGATDSLRRRLRL